LKPPFLRSWLKADSGQSIVETAMILPVLVVIVLGVSEVSWALLDQHSVTRLTREGSNLISRDTTLQDAATVMRGMSSRPINLDDGSSKVIFSVLKRGETTGTANFDRIILYQRYTYGSFGPGSKLTTAGTGSFGPAPDYQAVNSDTNTGLRVTNVPANLIAVRGGMLYVTEIYTRHTLITPLERFGISVPQTLYSIAYF
jgi:Flp pilus assembly protein TadG